MKQKNTIEGPITLDAEQWERAKMRCSPSSLNWRLERAILAYENAAKRVQSTNLFAYA